MSGRLSVIIIIVIWEARQDRRMKVLESANGYKLYVVLIKDHSTIIPRSNLEADIEA